MGKWSDEHVADEWMQSRQKMMSLFAGEESELDEIVKMVGMDALSPSDRLKMEAARSIREDFLTRTRSMRLTPIPPLRKQFLMMKLVLASMRNPRSALNDGASSGGLIKMAVRERIDAVSNIRRKIR